MCKHKKTDMSILNISVFQIIKDVFLFRNLFEPFQHSEHHAH